MAVGWEMGEPGYRGYRGDRPGGGEDLREQNRHILGGEFKQYLILLFERGSQKSKHILMREGAKGLVGDATGTSHLTQWNRMH
eukprot:scaffold85239_cov70-Cyclotella_meneghiniana.AAC.1